MTDHLLAVAPHADVPIMLPSPRFPSHRLPLNFSRWVFFPFHLRSDRVCFSEDYATIDNAAVFDGDFEDGSCSTVANSVPAGWRLADWDASVGLVSYFSRHRGALFASWDGLHLWFVKSKDSCSDTLIEDQMPGRL